MSPRRRKPLTPNWMKASTCLGHGRQAVTSKPLTSREIEFAKTLTAPLQARIAELEQVVAQSVSDIGQLVEMGAEVARYRRLIEMEVSIVPEEKICYYLRNPSELDELIKNEAIARSAK